MSAEGPGLPVEGEVSKKLTPTQKEALEEMLPFTADLRARGYPDWRIRDEQGKDYRGRWWSEIIDLALKAVTEEQVAKAREDGIQTAMGYVISKKADGLQDWQVEAGASRQGVPFVKEALTRVTSGQVAEEVKRRPKPTPDMVKVDQLVEELKERPEYLQLPEDEQGLAEGILRMRWDERSYVTIRYLLGETQDYEYLKRFDRAWVTTNFVKAEMLLEGKQAPRQTARGRKRSRRNRENSPEWQHSQELLRRERDVATMHLWKEEGKCLACGKLANSRNDDGVDYTHRHRMMLCPMCGRQPDSVFGAFVQDFDNYGYTQMYCPAHRPHVVDGRREAILAQAAHFRKQREETKKRRQEEKEKRALERKMTERMQHIAATPAEERWIDEDEDRYVDPEEEREGRLEDGE
jgi:hypothetical protein